MEQIVDYKSDTDAGHGKSLLCLPQLLINSKRTDTWCCTNSMRHFGLTLNKCFLM